MAAEELSSSRKGATSRAGIPEKILRQLNRGEIETKTLSEGLAIDFPTLVTACQFSKPFKNAKQLLSFEVGIKLRMQRVGTWIWEQLGEAGVENYQGHASDTVRGWVAYAIAAQPGVSLNTRLKQIRGLADDSHFGVREWAWIAMREHLSKDVSQSLKLFLPWAKNDSANIRRFAIESLRPRGVWCSHIAELKTNPELARAILELVKSDPSKYVQDSVANWLNDAFKTQPEWVIQLCEEWQRTSPGEATARICQRGLRSLKK